MQSFPSSCDGCSQMLYQSYKVTPLIKQLLRKRNKLRRKRCSEEACGRNVPYLKTTWSPFHPAVMVVRKRCIKATKLHLSLSSSFESVINYVVKVKSLKLTHLQKKINSLIVQSRSQGLLSWLRLIPSSLWAAVKSSVGSNRGNSTVTDQLLNNVDAVNDYFAGISYRPGIVNHSAPLSGLVSSNNDPLVDDYTLEPLLRRITPIHPLLYLLGYSLNVLMNWLV